PLNLKFSGYKTYMFCPKKSKNRIKDKLIYETSSNIATRITEISYILNQVLKVERIIDILCKSEDKNTFESKTNLHRFLAVRSYEPEVKKKTELNTTVIADNSNIVKG